MRPQEQPAGNAESADGTNRGAGAKWNKKLTAKLNAAIGHRGGLLLGKRLDPAMARKRNAAGVGAIDIALVVHQSYSSEA